MLYLSNLKALASQPDLRTNPGTTQYLARYFDAEETSTQAALKFLATHFHTDWYAALFLLPTAGHIVDLLARLLYLEKACVITSYSIHYTKLYEQALCWHMGFWRF